MKKIRRKGEKIMWRGDERYYYKKCGKRDKGNDDS